jgi:NAD(P)-dependent dehydrogenase (short-subunit alcohol dehydrogenase family)
MEDAVRRAAGDGTLDICIANAGVVLLEDFIDGTPAGWSAVLDVNVVGVMVTLQAAARRMLDDARGGRLLATASVAGIRGEPRSAVYCASKAGVIAVVQSLAVELAGAGITVNAVAPGEIDTAMHARAMDQLSRSTGVPAAELRATIVSNSVPLGRMGTPEDVAGLYAFLVSDDAAFITGETFRLDGGQLLV